MKLFSLFVALGTVVQPSGRWVGVMDGWGRGSAELRRPRQGYY